MKNLTHLFIAVVATTLVMAIVAKPVMAQKEGLA
jgi:hypothetical protein